MLLPFWQNLWTRYIFLPLILGHINLIAPAFSQTKSQTLGILETFKALSKINRDKEQKILELSKKNKVDNFEDALDVKINSTFLRSLLFFSKNKTLDLISKNTCNFYALMENGLIGNDLEQNSIIPVVIKKNDNSFEKGSTSLKLFLDFIYNNKCPQYKEYSLLFSKEYFSKTFEKLDFEVGKTNSLCKKNHNKWTKSPLIPYLCKIPKLIKEKKKIVKQLNFASTESEKLIYEKIKEINLYKKEIKESKKYYLKNLCDNIHSPKNFCSLYLAQDAWTKVVNKELPDYKLTYKCKQTLGSKEVNPKQKRKCASLFNKNPKICSLTGQLGRTSLFPSSSCNESSNSLIKSKLYSNYHDCPSRIYNHSITNLFRIIMHFTKGKINNSSLENCSFQSNKVFFTSIYREEYDDYWPLKMCYESKLSQKEVCLSYIPGYDKSLPLAENRVLEGILKKVEPVLSDIKCLISNKNKFNPARINYKSGCHVIYDYKKCKRNTCSKNIIVNKKVIKSVTYKNEPKLNYHPSNVSTNSFSSVNLTLERFNLRQKEITNLNQLKEFLKFGQGIIHGVGCIEEIYPSRFKISSMNQCRPIPFIIDGIIEKKFNYFLSVRTAIDDLHSPRLVNWSFIYNALKSYEGVHSINSWTLYGIENKN